MQKLLNSPLQIPDHDFNLIRDLVTTYHQEKSGAELCAMMEDLFTDDDLTASHYILFGFFVGEVSAALTAEANLYNQISNLCQRQN